MKKTVKILITVFIALNLAAAIHAQTRMVPPNNPNAAAGPGQAEIVINAENADKDIAVWVNGVLAAHVSPKTSEKIIVPNGRNIVEAADSTANRSGQWSTGTKRQIVVNSNSNRVTVGLTTRYGSLLSLTIQGTVALAPASSPASSAQTASSPPVIPAQPVITPQPTVTQPASTVGDGAEAFTLESAVKNAATKMIEDLPSGTSLAVLNISTNDHGVAEFVIEELEFLLVGSRQFKLIERRYLDELRAEHNLQISGDVDDNSAVSIGKMLGVPIVITGSVTGSGAQRRLRVRALDVQTAEILTIASERY